MSSGVEADVALDAAVVASLGMSRVLGAAAGATAGGAAALAALAEGRAAELAASLAAAESYERLLREVVDRNARISAVAESQDRAGTALSLPAPLELHGRKPSELAEERLTAWCEAADEALAEAERGISKHLAERAAARIFELPEAEAGAPTASPTAELSAPTAKAGAAPAKAGAAPAAEAGDGPQVDKGEGLQVDKGDGVQGDEGGELQVTLRRVLGRLPHDVSDEDLGAVTEVAERLAAGGTEAEAVLAEVRLRVQHAVRNAERRREEERRRVAEAAAAEQAAAERRYLLDTITTAFADMGYRVDAGFETMTSRDGAVALAGEGVRLTRDSWSDHSVRMRLDDAAGSPRIRAAMVRARTAESEEERRVDVEREREWCAAFEAARERLAGSGVRSDVTWRIDPGEQELPVTGRARHTRERARRKERGREHGHEE